MSGENSAEAAAETNEDIYVESNAKNETPPTEIVSLLRDVFDRAERGDLNGDLETQKEYWIRKRDAFGHLATFVLQSPQDMREAVAVAGKADVQAVRTNGRITGVIAEDE